MDHPAPADYALDAETSVSAKPPVSGRLHPLPVPDHELIRPIGQGSYGAVWLARNVMGIYRAVKVVYRKDFADERPFQREFNGIQRFEPISRSHSGFVNILQIGRNDKEGCFYYVMELADDARAEPTHGKLELPRDGRLQTAIAPVPSSVIDPARYIPRTLKAEVERRGRLPAGECVSLGLVLVSALQHLHENGMVHRDIKPSNIIIAGSQPKLADIGLVADLADARSFVGTEGFIPPEGAGTVQADIYSLGKVLYEISSGKDRHAFPEPPTELVELPDREELLELDEVIQQACEREPGRRYQTAQQMHEDLLLLRAGRSVRHLRKVERRLASATRVGAAGVLAALLTFGGFFIVRNQARRAVEISEREAELRQQAEASAEKARNEAAKSRQVAQFLKDMLASVGPAVAAGRDTTLLKEILAKTSTRVGSDLTNQPAVEAELMATIGEVELAIDQYQNAEAMLRSALATRRKVFGDESREVAETLIDLGETLSTESWWSVDKLGEAEPIAREAVAIQRKLFGNESVETAGALRLLAEVLSREKGRGEDNLNESELLAREAVKLDRMSSGGDSLDVSYSMRALALVLFERGNYSGAEAALREELVMDTKIHSQVQTATGGELLARVLQMEGKLSEAESLTRETLGIWKKLSNPESKPVATGFYKVAEVLQQEGKFTEAETNYRQAAAIARQIPNEPLLDGFLGETICRIGETLQKQGRLAEAEQAYQEALAIFQKRWPGDSTKWGWVSDRLATARKLQAGGQ